MDTLTLVYRHAANGKVKVHMVVGSKTNPEAGQKELETIPVATPFGVSARLRHIDQNDAYGLRAVVQDMNGKPRAVDFDRATLPRMGATEIRAALFAAGLRTEDDGEMIAVQCLKAADPGQAALQRPPSWADPTALPSRGCCCSCCKGQQWWCEREVPRGWRCSVCYPPDHLPSISVMEMGT